MNALPSSESSEHDFDFLHGTWQGYNRRLQKRLVGCEDWDEFDAICVTRPALGGFGTVDEFRTDYLGGLVGLAVRIFDPETRLWAIYWVDSRRPCLLESPVLGSFAGGVGVFDCEEIIDGQTVVVRFTWSRTETTKPYWEQSFSADGGETWEINWTNEWTRLGDAA